ncbi:MAG: hypothetical protein E6083_09665 [Cutibacterium avidum]|nr:hypothetical protein [Cutibacterium avidum]
MSRSCRRWWRVVVGVLVLLVVAEVPLAIGVLRPRLEPVPRRTDVVYAIGPADFHMAQARDLMRRTGASTLVVTISVDPRTGEEYRKDFCDPSPIGRSSVWCPTRTPLGVRRQPCVTWRRGTTGPTPWCSPIPRTSHARACGWTGVRRSPSPSSRRRTGLLGTSIFGGRLPVGWMGRGAGAELSVNRSPRKSLPMMTIEASISQASRSEDPLSATPRIGIILGSTRPGRVGGQGTTWDRPSSPRRRPPR